MLKRIILLLLLPAVLVGGYFAWQHYGKPYILAKRQENHDHIILHGNVEIRRVNLGFRVSGRVSEIHFEEGDAIRKGDVIARLDREPYEDSKAVAAAQVEIARENFAKLEAGNRPQEIEQARATLNERIASLNVLESDFRRAKELVERRVISEQEFETVVARRDEAEARRKLAEENLNLLTEGFRKEDVAIGRAQLSEATANLKKSGTSLADTELICPNDGILLTRIEEVGSVVAAGQIVATLSLQDAVWVYVYVPETVYDKIVPGMKAEIFTDSRPTNPYTGQVGYRSPEAEFTPKNVETAQLRTSLVYRVRIIVDSSGGDLPQGMPVTVKLKWKNNGPQFTVAE